MLYRFLWLALRFGSRASDDQGGKHQNQFV
jgi:hypothetical protein